jgi:putative sterol carrier protein
MALKFPSDEWIKELGRQLNASRSYERSAKNWEGDFIFICEPDAAYDDTAYLFLGLYHGKSTGAAMLDSEGEREAQFIIRAPYGNWRQVIEGKLDPIRGMMTRKLRLTGDMIKIMRYVAAAKEIVSCCALIPTDFGDE